MTSICVFIPLNGDQVKAGRFQGALSIIYSDGNKNRNWPLTILIHGGGVGGNILHLFLSIRHTKVCICSTQHIQGTDKEISFDFLSLIGFEQTYTKNCTLCNGFSSSVALNFDDAIWRGELYYSPPRCDRASRDSNSDQRVVEIGSYK